MRELYNEQHIDLLADKKKGDTPSPLSIELLPATVELLHVFNMSIVSVHVFLAPLHAAPGPPDVCLLAVVSCTQ